MPAKGKGKRKVTSGPIDPRKTREPVTGHPCNTDAGDESDSSAVTTIAAAPPPLPTTSKKPVLSGCVPMGMSGDPEQDNREHEAIKTVWDACCTINEEPKREKVWRYLHEIAEALGLKWASLDFEEELGDTRLTQDAATMTEIPPPTPQQVVKPTTTTRGAQTSPPPPVRDDATEPTEPTPEPKTYAEVAVQASATTRAKRREQKASEVVRVPKPQPKQQRGRDTTTGSSTSENPPAQARTLRRASPGGEGGLEPTPTRAVVLHGVPTKYKPGQMRRWIQEDNPTGAPKIIGIHWLLQDHRRVGKLASSLVIYLNESVIVSKGLRMGRKIFRTTNYDWDR